MKDPLINQNSNIIYNYQSGVLICPYFNELQIVWIPWELITLMTVTTEYTDYLFTKHSEGM